MKKVHYINPCRKNIKKDLTDNENLVTCSQCIKKNSLTPWWKKEEDKREYVQSTIKAYEEGFYPSAKMEFEIGSEVQILRGDENTYRVYDTSHQGKYYYLFPVDGHWMDSGFIVPWTYLRAVSQSPRLNVTKLPDIRFSNSTLESLVLKFYSTGIEMNPKYQRGSVWTIDQKRSLIHSIFRGVEIGRFLFKDREYTEEEPKGYEIVDGKQRLSAIVGFIEGDFTYQGLLYRDMHMLDRRAFQRFGIQWGTLDTDTDTKEIIEMFIALNTHGSAIAVSHMNHVKDLFRTL